MSRFRSQELEGFSVYGEGLIPVELDVQINNQEGQEMAGSKRLRSTQQSGFNGAVTASIRPKPEVHEILI